MAIILLLVCFVIMIFFFYSAAMRYMSRYDSMSPNVNVQTHLLWAVVLTIIHDSQTVGRNDGGGWIGFLPAMFFASFIMIALGVILDKVVLVPREATASRRWLQCCERC